MKNVIKEKMLGPIEDIIGEREAYELAEEKYCTGDYEEHPENSETWSTENVTKEYNV